MAENTTDNLANSNTLKITHFFLILEYANPVYAQQVITDFNGLEVNRMGKSEQAIALYEPSARSSQLNLVPFLRYSASEVTIIASAIHP